MKPFYRKKHFAPSPLSTILFSYKHRRLGGNKNLAFGKNLDSRFAQISSGGRKTVFTPKAAADRTIILIFVQTPRSDIFCRLPDKIFRQRLLTGQVPINYCCRKKEKQKNLGKKFYQKPKKTLIFVLRATNIYLFFPKILKNQD